MRKVVICANINEEFMNSIHKLSLIPGLKEAEVHLVHCMKNIPYLYDFAATYYPTESQMDGMKSSIKDILANQKETLTKDNDVAKFEVEVLSSSSPEEKIVSYLEEVKADLVVTVTGKRGDIASLFHSSFSNYMSSHAPCDVYILRDT